MVGFFFTRRLLRTQADSDDIAPSVYPLAIMKPDPQAWRGWRLLLLPSRLLPAPAACRLAVATAMIVRARQKHQASRSFKFTRRFCGEVGRGARPVRRLLFPLLARWRRRR